MKRKIVQLIFVVVLVALQASGVGGMYVLPAAAQGTGADLYIKDTPLDAGIEPNPDPGPMWVTEDIWVRTTPDPNYNPYPFPEASPPWIPSPHENPEYRDPKYSRPNYVYVRVRNRGDSPSTGTEQLKLYWAKASTGLSWPTQWVDYLVSSGGSNTLYGAEVTKPRKNAATATPDELNAYRDAILAIGTTPSLLFPGGVSYWHKQDEVHEFGPSNRHGSATIGSLAFLPWHREMINRYEVLLQEYNPTVKLLYWDWTTNPELSTGGFNFFTSSFMGASGRGGTSPASIASPFIPPTGPSLAPPAVTRWLAFNPTTPTSASDATVLNNTAYFTFTDFFERTPHNRSHVYIGGCNNATCSIRGDMSIIASAAEDPFFFLLHANVDRLWAQWQRVALSRLDPATAYDSSSSNANITTVMRPWDGTGTSIRPWTTADGYIVSKSPPDPSVVSPPIYDTARLVVPVLQPGEAVVIQIPWYPANPADFASFGDPGHFCLLGRIETSTTTPFGMTFPEGTDVFINTKNNNNIAWKNITVVDNFPGALKLTSILMRNVFDEPVLTGLRFANAEGFDASFFDFGSISVDLKPELFNRWREGGAVGRGIEPVGGTIIRIESPQSFIQNFRLEPGETFSVDVHFELFKDYRLERGVSPKWDLIQIGTDQDPEAIVGGQRFEIDFSKLVLVKAGSKWRYLDDGSNPDPTWLSPDFDDSKWKLGQAELGFGNNPVTTIGGGSPDRRRITTYFRHTFDVADPSFFQTIYLRLRRNDGALVYLNGTEIHRVNLPEGEITPRTPATRDVGGLEREMFFPIQVERELLVQGKNVVAVEIHLASASSQDLSFDLELYANPGDPRFPPDIAFASPMNGALFQTGQVIPIQVEALDGDGKITAVSFFADGELLGTDDDPPYTFQWDGAPLGSHRLRAVAMDNDGDQATVDLTITVLENVPPIVELTEPIDGAVFSVGETIRLAAQASDPGGAIQSVEFHLSDANLFGAPDQLFGIVEASPYTLTWDLTGIAPGHYMLIALAKDDAGATSQSIPIHLHVEELGQSPATPETVPTSTPPGGTGGGGPCPSAVVPLLLLAFSLSRKKRRL